MLRDRTPLRVNVPSDDGLPVVVKLSLASHVLQACPFACALHPAP
jgi:hypothetical protein